MRKDVCPLRAFGGTTFMQTESGKNNVVDNGNIGGANKDTAFIKCENCGGNMVFDPQIQALRCEHCGSVDDFKKDKHVEEHDIEKGFDEAQSWSGEATLFRCENCGAEVIMQSGEVAAKCPFCGTPHIVKTDEMPGIKPQALYPFLLSKEQASEAAKKWARKCIFAPRKFKKTLSHENMNGIYQPCFTFDSNTFSKYAGRIGERRTRTVKTSNGTRTETYIEWRNVSGTISKFFDDVFVSSGDTTQSELNKIMPFKTETLCVYEHKFLSGYVANHYKRDLKDCWKDAKNMMDAAIRRAILNQYGCTEVDYLNVSTTHEAVTYKYVLLPVYRTNFNYRKKQYPVTVNGNTGRVSGKTPLSPLRVAIAIILTLALFIGLGWLWYNSDGDVNIEFGSATPAEIQTAALSQDFCGSEVASEFKEMLGENTREGIEEAFVCGDYYINVSGVAA